VIQQTSNLQFIRHLMYDLKRRYPSPATVIKYLNIVTDPTTGRRSATKRMLEVRKGILLPSSLSNKFIYDRSYMAADKDFTYGGFFNLNDRIYIIDAKDVPSDFKIGQDDYLIVANSKYVVKLMNTLNNNYYVMLTITETLGALPYAVTNISVNHCLQMGQLVNES
jgi:hypothetical protein